MMANAFAALISNGVSWAMGVKAGSLLENFLIDSGCDKEGRPGEEALNDTSCNTRDPHLENVATLLSCTVSFTWWPSEPSIRLGL
jgi:hypothetical protein